MGETNSSEPVGQRLGDFEIVRELGRGGMGVVYEARQVSLNRKVALKVLSGGLGLTGKAVQRFRREAEAAAKLHHTNIVPVYATGEEHGTHYYAMGLIEGPSLDRVIRQLRQPPGRTPEVAPRTADGMAATGPYVTSITLSAEEATALNSSGLSSDSNYFDTVARMVAEVADALEYAQQQGVIHRDIKPSNLLLSPAGRLSLNDFGLARVLEQPGMTLTGEFVGTPRYMSPEQITAGRTPLDHRTDIYSLGATLYEMLTWQPPFLGEQREQLLGQILHKEPQAPRRVNKKVPVDLETICLKCLEKDPDRRYQTAGQLAEDLRRYVNRFAIQARRAGPIRRLAKWVRRRPALAAALTCALILALFAVFFAYRAHVVERERLVQEERARVELLAEKQQNALDKAMAAAMSGSLQETDKAIAEAERLGASTGQVHMLWGLVAFYRDELERAVTELEQAVALLPDSLAARSLLGYFCAVTGQTGRYLQIWKEIEQLTPVRPEDYLFKGLLDPVTAHSRQTMDEAIRLHDSVIGRTMRELARAEQAMEMADPKDAELALEDLEIARRMLPDNPQVMYLSVMANLAAAAAYEETGQLPKRDVALQAAKRAAQTLERFDTLPSAVEGRWAYFQYTGQDDALFDLLSRWVTARGTTDSLVLGYALCLYERGQFSHAVEVLSRSKHRDIYLIEVPRAFMLAELAGGPGRACEAYRNLAGCCTARTDIWASQCLLLFLGRKSEAVATSLRMRDRHGGPWPALGSSPLDYVCGDLSAEDLLKAAGRSKSRLCNCYFFIALMNLANGDRSAAQEHFRKAVATRFLPSTSYNWSKAFLARMEKDPNWPPWIPVKK